MKFDFENVTEKELWRFVGKHLADNGFDAVLVGGAVVSIYTEGAYQSGDLDFVIQNILKTDLPSVMKEIGFHKKGKNYIHPECKHLFVEFPPGPLGIGEDYNITPIEENCHGTEILILSPTDCVKDRLASYIHFKAQECLDQAVMVANKHPVNLEEIEKWCREEKGEAQWKNFIQRLKSSSL